MSKLSLVLAIMCTCKIECKLLISVRSYNFYCNEFPDFETVFEKEIFIIEGTDQVALLIVTFFKKAA